MPSRDIKIFFNLVIGDLKRRFSASALGIFWAVLGPLMSIIIYWFVIEKGMKAHVTSEVPFFPWLASGIIFWNFVSDSLLTASNSIVEYDFLVKKMVFKIEILPVVKVVSSAIIHFVLMFFLIIVLSMAYQIGISASMIQLPFYFVITSSLILGFSFILSTFTVFLRDTSNILSIVLQFLFWLTPIAWNSKNLPEEFKGIVAWNPFSYLLEGYRDSLFSGDWIINKPPTYAVVTSLILIIHWIGYRFFMRSKKLFVDSI